MPSNLPIREMVEWLRNDLVAQRQAVRQLHDRRLAGSRVSAKLATLIDTIVFRLFDATLAALEPSEAAALRAGVSIVGLGSYGRRQCAPHSDVDLMILHDLRSSEALAVQLRPLTQGVFDVGLRLGHTVRTVNEAVQQARDDAIIGTSMIDARPLLGNQQLFETFRDRFQKMVRRNSKTACRMFLDARRIERDQYGETVYLLEPHVKRSRGGLRDLNLLRWLSFAQQGISDPDRLHLKGGLSKLDYRRLVSARDFLLQLRNEMHFHADSARDLLDRTEQLRVAQWYGHTPRSGLLPVEHFMRDYFRHTNHLWQMVRRRNASLQVASPVSRVLEPVFGRTIDGDFRVGMRTISATSSGVAKIKRDLSEVLRLVEISVREGKNIDHTTWSILLLAAPEFTGEISDPIRHQFYQLLADPASVGEILRVLHELGFLGKFVPAMRHARHLLQFNQYHKYTVDEHCLRAVRKAAAFGAQKDALGEAYREIKDKRVLHLALLLHDLGKGFEEDHSEVGRRLTEETATLFKLDDASRDDAVFLVHQHLKMAHLTFRRDTSDLQLLARFAREVGSVERLRMLFVLSCADLAAVGPGVLNDWKRDVLADVFVRSAKLLEEGATEGAETKLEMFRAEVLESLTATEQADSWFMRQVAALPAGYLAKNDIATIVETLHAFHDLADGAVKVRCDYHAETNTLELLAGVNRGVGRGVFSSMAGALSVAGMQILAASTDTLPERFLMLRYTVTNPKNPEAPTAEQLEQICQALAASVDSDAPPRFPSVWGERQDERSTQLSLLPNEVRIDNHLSEEYTIVEVFTFDRRGLLYSLTRKLHDLKLIICHAKIGTYLDQVVDVFYLTDRQRQKITDDRQLQHLREQLIEVVEQTTAE